MNSTLISLVRAVRRSSLTPEDQRVLMGILSLTDSPKQAEVLSLIEEDPSWASRLLENVRQKREAVQSKKLDAFKEIVEDELRQVETLLTSSSEK